MFSKEEVNYLNGLILSKLESDYDFESKVVFKWDGKDEYKSIMNKVFENDNYEFILYEEVDEEGNGIRFRVDLWVEGGMLVGRGDFENKYGF
jgi:hypothetical protein